MEFRRLTTSGHDMYEKAMDLYKVSFPEHEQRESHLQTDIMENEEYHFNLIYENDIWVGEFSGGKRWSLSMWSIFVSCRRCAAGGMDRRHWHF